MFQNTIKNINGDVSQKIGELSTCNCTGNKCKFCADKGWNK